MNLSTHSIIHIPPLRIFLVLCAAALFSWDALASPGGTAFNDLSPEIQDSLSPLADTWENIPPKRQQTLIRFTREANNEMRQRIKRHAKRWKTLSPAERSKVHRAMHKYENLPLHKQKALRERWNSMPDRKHRAKNQAPDQYDRISPEKRRQIRDKVRAMSREERREFLKQIKRHQSPASAEQKKPEQ
ncbi:MAG: DUF3106 domain-containing protein [Porticoccaceae bacterium]